MLGREVKKQNKDYYERIGIGFEFPTLYEKLTARQNLIFFGSLYKKSPRDLDALLESLELTHDADKKVAGYLEGHEKPPWLSARSHKRSGRVVP